MPGGPDGSTGLFWGDAEVDDAEYRKTLERPPRSGPLQA
jgi:hypothetical protein